MTAATAVTATAVQSGPTGRAARAGQQQSAQPASRPSSRATSRPRQGGYDDDEFGGGRRGRRGRYRDRNRRGRRDGFEVGPAEPQVTDDDVLIPVAGILDILDNYAFVRTSGYLPGPNDVYVSLAQVRKNGLRKGDDVTGAVRQPKDGERREKFNALVRLDSVNGMEPGERPRPSRVQQAHPALPAGPAAPGDRPGRADHPDHRPGRRRSARASAV